MDPAKSSRSDKSSRRGSSETGSKGSAVATVTSGMSRLVQTVQGAADPASTDKVERIQQQLAKGEYQISSEEIADGLIRETLRYAGLLPK